MLLSYSASSSSSPSTSSTSFQSSKNPEIPKSVRRVPIKSVLQSPPPSRLNLTSSSSTDLPSPVLQEPPSYDDIVSNKENLEQLLVVRRPMKDSENDDYGGESNDDDDSEKEEDNGGGRESPIDTSLENFAKKLPIFEPERGYAVSKQKPLLVNLDLALYRAKVLTKNFQFEEADNILQKCIYYWPEDGRAYVALGKLYRKQSRIGEARAVYEKGCQATHGENAYIWQCWADLENKMGNVRRARELFDAATVADKKHVAAWHGWAVLELKQGYIRKARNLLGKGLKYCRGNEYIYQTLALLEAKANRYERARYLFRQATKCNPKSCASWLAWAQLEMQQENDWAARRLFEQAVQASPKNRFAWHVWGIFEANLGNTDMARKLLKIGHIVNPRDPVLLQSLALLEYKHATANVARVLFRKASDLDPKHQPVWFAWGWMEWKEGNIAKAREMYQKVLSIDPTTESAARCLQAWGVLEQRAGNLSAARRYFRSSLNINSQSYVTWMTWASFEEDQGNSVRAEEIRNLYFQQRTEVVDDASWVMGFMDVIDPALDNIKKLLKIDEDITKRPEIENSAEAKGQDSSEELVVASAVDLVGTTKSASRFNLDVFIKEKLCVDASKLDDQMEASLMSIPKLKGPQKSFRLKVR